MNTRSEIESLRNLNERLKVELASEKERIASMERSAEMVKAVTQVELDFRAKEIAALKEKRITVYRDDAFPAYGAFAKCDCASEQCNDQPLILLNVEACFTAGEFEDGTTAPEPSTSEAKALMVETLMHEFGHALEHWLGLPHNEEAIEKAIESFRQPTPQPTSQKEK